MTGLERELASMRQQLEANNRIVAALMDGVERLAMSVESFAAAMSAEDGGDNPVLAHLETLVGLSREQRKMLLALIGPKPR